MCLFSVIYQTIPGCPVLVFANREESPQRPSTTPAIRESHQPQCVWLGGTDLRARGTWLGVNGAGVIAAITNRRKADVPQNPKSRGLLCRELLEQGSLDKAEAEFHRQWHPDRFAGFNLILISQERGLVISATEALQIQPLTPGFHAITNGDWDDPRDRRIARVLGLMETIQQSRPSLEEWISQAKRICGLGEAARGDAVCIPCTKGWGTVSSGIIALTDHPQQARYLHAAGSPAETAYEDYSQELRTLLEGPA